MNTTENINLNENITLRQLTALVNQQLAEGSAAQHKTVVASFRNADYTFMVYSSGRIAAVCDNSTVSFSLSDLSGYDYPVPGHSLVCRPVRYRSRSAEKERYTDLYKQSLITLTEFEKMMGKKKFNELLGSYVAKPPGKLALVPESHPREAVDLTEPSQEFSVLPDEE